MTPRDWAAAWALARHERALYRRTLALWAAPALWVLQVILLTGVDLRLGLQDAAGTAWFAGLMGAALAVSLPARTRAALARRLSATTVAQAVAHTEGGLR